MSQPFSQPELEKLLLLKKKVSAGRISEAEVKEVKSALKMAGEEAFSLHTKAVSYLKPFALSHLDLVEIAYELNRLQVQRRLSKALESPVRSGPLKFQIQSEKAELEKLDQEIEMIHKARSKTFSEVTSLFHLKGCFYHVYEYSQRLLLDCDLLHLSETDQKAAELVLDFLICWMEDQKISSGSKN